MYGAVSFLAVVYSFGFSQCSIEDFSGWTTVVQSVINVQTPCHLHFVNKEKIYINFLNPQPLSVDSEKNYTTSFPLTKVKGIRCVVLLILRVSLEKDRYPPLPTSIDHIIPMFGSLFINDIKYRIQLRYSNSYLTTHSMLIYVTVRPNPFEDIGHVCHRLLNKFIAVVQFIPSATFKSGFETKVSILCRFCGRTINAFLNVSLTEVLNVVRYHGKHTIEDVRIHKKYNGNNYFIRLDVNAISSVLENGRLSSNLELRHFAANLNKKSFHALSQDRHLTEMYLLEIIFKHINASIWIWEEMPRTLFIGFRTMSVSGLDVARLLDKTYFLSLGKKVSFTVPPITHSFLTCYHFPVLTYYFYFSPFHRFLWITFVTFFIIVGLFLKFLILQEDSLKSYMSFPVSMFMLSTITDDSCGMPDRLCQNWKIRFSLGPWYLGTVLFVNAYLGLVISSLTTPFGLQSVEYLSNLTQMIYSEDEIIKRNLWKEALDYNYDKYGKTNKSVANPRPFQNKSEFYILSSFLYLGNSESTTIGMWLKFQYFWQQIMRRILRELAFPLGYYDEAIPNERNYTYDTIHGSLVLNLFFPVHTYVPKDAEQMFKDVKNGYEFISNSSFVKKIPSIVEKEITKCERTVFVDSSEAVQKEFKYLSQHYPTMEFFMSKEQFFSKPRYWSFEDATEDSTIVQKLRYLLCSGIYEHVQGIFGLGFSEFRKNWTLSNNQEKNSGRNEPRAVSLQDRVQTSFVMYSFLISVSWIAFIFEVYMMPHVLASLRYTSLHYGLLQFLSSIRVVRKNVNTFSKNLQHHVSKPLNGLYLKLVK